MKKIFIPILAVIAFVFFIQNTLLAVDIVWTGTADELGYNNGWCSIASDVDGSSIFAAVSYGRIFNSADSGATWAESRPAGDVDKDWRSIASDDDGSNLIAAVYNGRVYISTTSGATWAESLPAGDINEKWTMVASDADGSNLIAVINYGWVYISTTSGATWVERRPAGNVKKNWSAVASDADGSNLIATVSNGRTYISTTSGAVWAESFPAGDTDQDWKYVASDADGSNLIAAVFIGRLYTSADAGVTWVERRPAGDFDKNWQSVASDADGSNLVAAAYGGRLYISENSGVGWTEKYPVGNDNQNWYSVASNNSGSRLAAAVNGGQLYLGVLDEAAPTLTSISLASDNADTVMAKAGDTITLSFAANENLGTAAVVFKSGGAAVLNSVALASTTGKDWTASYLVDSSDVEGDVTFTLNFVDLAANNGVEAIETTDDTAVTVDLTAPGEPSASPVAETYYSSQSVVLNAVGASSIRYSIDGSIPSCSSGWIYSAPIRVSSSKTVKAIACDNAGNASAVVSFAYVILLDSGAGSTAFSLPAAIGGGEKTVDIPMGGRENVNLLNAGSVNILAYIGSQAELTVLTSQFKTEQHTLKISEVDLAGNTITLQIWSEPQTVKLALKESARIDLDNDKIPDLLISFANVYVNRIELTVSQLVIKGGEGPAIKIKETVSPEKPRYVFKKSLWFGQSGPDVRELQKYLNNHGFAVSQSGFGSSGNETNYFGALTRQALANFQKANRIFPAVGFFGPKTRAAVNK
jgi:hypothetical protein